MSTARRLRQHTFVIADETPDPESLPGRESNSDIRIAPPVKYYLWGIPFIQVKFVTPAKAGVQRAIVAINIDSAFTGMTL